MKNDYIDVSQVKVGIVGLGLMGSSITVALLLAGHKVYAVEPVDAREAEIRAGMEKQLRQGEEMGLTKETIENIMERLTISGQYVILQECQLVMECVVEQLDIKAFVYKNIAEVVGEETVIGSNTSAIPISVLQQFVPGPTRFLGVHWAEPAFTTRFLEISCGKETDLDIAQKVFELAHLWGKEPTLLKKDIRGFITNRLMYAVYREAFAIMKAGNASMEDIDKAFQYDAGAWMTFMGIFRRMDYVGVNDFYEILMRWVPQLSNADEVPAIMQQLVDQGAKGIHNGKGLYPYGKGEAEQWDRAFAAFNKDIHKLASDYLTRDINEQIEKQL